MYNNLFIKPILHNKVKQNNILLSPMKLCDYLKSWENLNEFSNDVHIQIVLQSKN